MQLKTFATALLLSSTILTSSALADDQIFFKNGDKISGKIVSVSEDVVTIETLTLGDLSIDLDKIESVNTDQNLGVFGSNKTYLEEKTDFTTLEPAAGDEGDRNYVGEFINGTLGIESEGYLRLGATLQEGNTETKGVNFEGHLDTDLDDVNRVRIDGEYHYEEDDGDVTEDNRSIDLMHDYFVSPKWFVNSNLGFKTDKEAELELQTTVGVGLGYQMYDFDDLSLSFTLGPSYLSEEFENGNTEESVAGRWALDYDQKFYDGFLKAFHNHEILQSMDDTENFQLESKTGLSVPITDHFSGILQVDYDFDNAPAAGSEREDTTYSLKLGYEW